MVREFGYVVTDDPSGTPHATHQYMNANGQAVPYRDNAMLFRAFREAHAQAKRFGWHPNGIVKVLCHGGLANPVDIEEWDD